VFQQEESPSFERYVESKQLVSKRVLELREDIEDEASELAVFPSLLEGSVLVGGLGVAVEGG